MALEYRLCRVVTGYVKNGARETSWLWALPALLVLLCAWSAGRSAAPRPRGPLRHAALTFTPVAAEPADDDDSDTDWGPPRSDSAPRLPHTDHLLRAAAHGGPPTSPPAPRRMLRRQKIPAASTAPDPPY